MREIPLTNSDKVALVDDEDYEKVMRYKWYLTKRDYVYSTSKINNKALILHRYIMNLTLTKLVIDHKNHNKLDNCKNNLRVCFQKQNSRNRNKPNIANITSKYKGVCSSRNGKCWIAQIAYNGEKVHIGRFDTEIEAARAYDEAALYYHKAYAYCNFKDSKCNNYIPNKYTEKVNNKTSKYVGIHWDDKANKWMCRTQIKGKRFYLGLFDTENEALSAKINFIEENKVDV